MHFGPTRQTHLAMASKHVSLLVITWAQTHVHCRCWCVATSTLSVARGTTPFWWSARGLQQLRSASCNAESCGLCALAFLLWLCSPKRVASSKVQCGAQQMRGASAVELRHENAAFMLVSNLIDGMHPSQWHSSCSMGRLQFDSTGVADRCLSGSPYNLSCSDIIRSGHGPR